MTTVRDTTAGHPATAGGRRGALGAPAVTPRPLPAYRAMFLLTDRDLTSGPVLDCPAGASPFGAQVRALGGQVVSVDPAYAGPADVPARALADIDRVVAWQRADPEAFDWSYLGSPELLRDGWRAAVEEFSADFAVDGVRYLAAALPDLPFPDRHFALTLSGFLLFVYPELLDHGDHRDALLELVRVTRGEVRAYPLHDTTGDPYPRLAELRADLHACGVHTELRPTGTSYSSRPGSDRMLVCRRSPGQGRAAGLLSEPGSRPAVEPPSRRGPGPLPDSTRPDPTRPEETLA